MADDDMNTMTGKLDSEDSKHHACSSSSTVARQPRPALRFSDLPDFRIVRGGHTESLVLSRAGGTIEWLARRIRTEIPNATRVGLVFPTCPELILVWLALLRAGKEPCILQYPTKKLSTEYWRASVQNSIANCAIGAIIHGNELSEFRINELAHAWILPPHIGTEQEEATEILSGAIVQLSSGTTGHRKGVRLSLEQIREHITQYNETVHYTPNDVIVSWLPLYHDMGFIACFVMPLLLGVPVVMIDPVEWVRDPGVLFNLIGAHGGTVCYMPNFGFEVMSREPLPKRLETMRMWVSCSEPTQRSTIERFCRSTGIRPEAISSCYGMAENVFAVSQSQGFRILRHEGSDYVSCGRAICGTSVKIVAGELFVKSDCSVRQYVGSEDVRDEQGYYPTGDMGMVIGEEIVVCGRKRDILLTAGKKLFLHDLDHIAGTIFPQSAGRIATLADFNETLGTETALFLVEGGRYWDESIRAEALARIRAATELESCDLHFVPPSFITKTSSGKINRQKTLQDWKLHRAWRRGVDGPPQICRRGTTPFLEQVRESFGEIHFDRPVGEVLDSLGSVVFRLICDEHGLAFDAGATVEQLASRARNPAVEAGSGQKVFSIVALLDGVPLGFGGRKSYITPAFIKEIEQKVGAPVRIEHFAVPPPPVLLSDLVFHEFFMPREVSTKYSAFSGVIQKIKEASLILIDDEDSIRMLEFSAYPRLSYRFANNPRADLVAFRLSEYTLNHHLLARDVVLGSDISYESITPSIDAISRFLGVPIMKMAFHAPYRYYTQGWDYVQYRPNCLQQDAVANSVDASAVQNAILGFIGENCGNPRLSAAVPSSGLVMNGPPHFCSFLLNQRAVDYVTNRYSSFCIAGLPSSAPYIEKRLRAMKKSFFYAGNLNPIREDFDAMLCTGFFGPTSTRKPYFEFMQIGEEGGRPRNVTPQVMQECPLLVESDPELLARHLAVHKTMPIGNSLFNAVRRRELAKAKNGATS